MKKTIIAAALVSASLVSSAWAQSPAEFYRGKTVELLIGFGTGGSNDTYSRMVGAHIGKHIPGNPTLVPQNMTGAGGAKGLGASASAVAVPPTMPSTVASTDQALRNRTEPR